MVEIRLGLEVISFEENAAARVDPVFFILGVIFMSLIGLAAKGAGKGMVHDFILILNLFYFKRV